MAGNSQQCLARGVQWLAIVSNGYENSPLYTCSNSGSNGRLDIVPLGDVVVVICCSV